MTITKIVYARLFNLGNYENERLEVEITVENNDYAAAFITAREAVEAQQAQFRHERDEAARRQREEWEAEQARLRAERAAEAERRRQETYKDTDENPF